jgi:hypothetical protein
MVVLSEQQLVDCAWDYDSSGMSVTGARFHGDASVFQSACVLWPYCWGLICNVSAICCTGCDGGDETAAFTYIRDVGM